MAIPAHTTGVPLAHLNEDTRPNTLPELYSIVVTGPGSDVFTSGERQVFSRVASYGKGDLVLLWRRPDLVKSGQQLVFARLKSAIPAGVNFGGPTPPGVDDVIFAETASTKQQLSYKIAGLLAIHKWLGGMKDGQQVHEFVHQHAAAKKEPVSMTHNVPVQQSALPNVIGVGVGAGPLTMSSREIADLLGSRHDNVKVTIERLTNRCVIELPALQDVKNHLGQTVQEYRLDKRSSLIVVAQLSPEFTAKVVDRWQDLEEAVKQAAPRLPNFADPVAAARAWADAKEAEQIAVQRALIAEQTKAEIGSRREATAMNTASQAVKKANRLEQELDRHQSYASIKRMSMLYHGQEFNWRLLKRTSIEMGIPAIDVFDQNYGTVKAYHADVWQEAYALEIPGRLDDEAA
ncbi:Rha family transcriptional regulator [Pseudochelatococcus sp. B33]